MEIEAKFNVLDRSAARDLLAAEALGDLPGIGGPRRVRLTDRYLDTTEGHLRRAGWAARLRTADGGTRIQLKQTAPVGPDGLQRRAEFDGPAEPGDDPSGWPRSAARRRLLQLARGEPLAATVSLRQDRLVRDFGDGATRVELSLDRTAVLVGEALAGRLTLLELELRVGTEAALQRAAATLRAQGFLSPSTGTKLAWAMSLMANRTRLEALPVIGAEDEPLRPEDPTAEVGRRILRAQVRRLLDRERAFLESSGPEDIRRLRVATRRLRATWRAFGDAYEGRLPDRLRRRLSELGDLLSAVRDLDVLLGRLSDAGPQGAADRAPGADPAPGTDLRGGLAGLAAWIENRRARALGALQAELGSPRHRRWLDELADFVETPGQGVVPIRPPAPRLAREQVGGWVWGSFERVLAWAPLVDVADIETLHELRIEGKRLRDVIQVVEPLAGTSAAGLTASLVRLQDALGAMNDAAVTAAMCRAYLESIAAPSAGEASAVQRFAVLQERAMARARRRVPSAWRAATGPAARRRVASFIGSI